MPTIQYHRKVFCAIVGENAEGTFTRASQRHCLYNFADITTDPINYKTMINRPLFSVVVALLVASAVADSIFNKALLDSTSPGVCIDGSPAGHFVSEGSGVNRTKFLLYFEGGLTCGEGDLQSTLESCYQNLETNQGSSKYLPDSFNGRLAGILSGDVAINPHFSDWTRIIFMYCDGAMYQGHKAAPVSYKSTDLYFRGQNITQERFNWLNAKYAINTNATDIILAGSDDGAIGALLWANHLQDAVKGKVRVIADSGVLLDVVNPTTKRPHFQDAYINIMKLSNVEVGTPCAECNTKYPTERWRCLFFENLYATVKQSMFVVDSLYDEESFGISLGVDCIDSFGTLDLCNATEKASIEGYKSGVINLLNKATAISGNGAWAPACVTRGGLLTKPTWTDNTFQTPMNSGYTIEKSVNNWFLGVAEPEKYKHVDTVSWPNNAPCSGVTTLQRSLMTE